MTPFLLTRVPRMPGLARLSNLPAADFITRRNSAGVIDDVVGRVVGRVPRWTGYYALALNLIRPSAAELLGGGADER